MGAESFFARYGPINDRAPPSSQSSYDVRIFYPGAALLPEDYMKGLRLHMRVSRSYPSGTAASKDSSALRGLTVEGKAYSSAELSKLVEHFRGNACTLTGASSPVSARLFVPSHHFVEMTLSSHDHTAVALSHPVRVAQGRHHGQPQRGCLTRRALQEALEHPHPQGAQASSVRVRQGYAFQGDAQQARG
ncbi:hypothetical protein SAMD00019534_068630 [Acytostelium subglobosum LB1]|uniref:hypothetical protein n=1 Tax=Acytostelium subglobosum LB1 TaxID=1410327 RepID=UPI000644B9C5|nr:hypothetical protein SAMD00019534_068630 [Acytostelium subglobosum LB1]GAM23688.1 hypothetical protein SAMD00019534_068630 [Acytostelium subglobosum LB1]|eukprot:XP_012753429.1 hypothetical protein SAMD00019534_068630 [Acytostelium subglobosum LB1]